MEKFLKILFFFAAVTGYSSLFPPFVLSARVEKLYCVAELPTPTLNTPYFSSVFGGRDGKSVKVDKTGLIRELEFIALEGTVFEIRDIAPENGHDILKVTTLEYPSENSLYIDSRFVRYAASLPPARTKKLPAMGEIIKTMYSLEGKPYMWGGNVSGGINKMTEFYKPRGGIDRATLRLWRLEGVDCSGLLYEATDGFTPRNTSSLVGFGRGLKIEGLTAEEISRRVMPLDLIVWSGHVVIVTDSSSVIESSVAGGVKTSSLAERLSSIMSERRPVNDWNSSGGKRFVIRRWYPPN
jgi:hypothetical protein